MPLPRILRLCVGFLIAILILWLGGYFVLYLWPRFGDGRSGESVGSKAEGAMLQAIEAQYRDTPLSADTQIFTKHGYSFLCVRSEKGHRIWIMLNPKYPPYYKQLPLENFSMTFEEAINISRNPEVKSTVRNVLFSHVDKEKS